MKLVAEIVDGAEVTHQGEISWSREYRSVPEDHVLMNDAFVRVSRSNAESLSRAVIRTVAKKVGDYKE
jgi:hypothetical protein